MTLLSVNVNKIALLRNARGTDFPNLLEFIDQLIGMGVKGITVHPRPDQRHITRKDVFDIREFLMQHPDVEFNIEGYPGEEFLDMVCRIRPTQCTLVPDAPRQLTSDHGWDVKPNLPLLKASVAQLKNAGIRTSLFADADLDVVAEMTQTGTDRLELYTEDYAMCYDSEAENRAWDDYRRTALRATDAGLGVNAGHDLNLENLPRFLEIPDVLEVSIGHALVVECLQQGIDKVVSRYLEICAGNPQAK